MTGFGLLGAAALAQPSLVSTVPESRELAALGLEIRAPLSGIVTVLSKPGPVKQSGPLLKIDDYEVRQDIARAELAAEVIERTAQSATDEGSLRQALKVRLDQQAARQGLVNSMSALVQSRAWALKDVQWRAARAEPGYSSEREQVAVAELDLAMANYMLADSQAQYLQSELDVARAGWTIEDLELALPFARKLQAATLQRLSSLQQLSQVSAQVDGHLDLLIDQGTPVERGALIARVASASMGRRRNGAMPRRMAVAPQSALLLKYAQADGAKVATGDVLCNLDATDLELEKLNLAFLKAQVDRQSLRLGEPELKMHRAVAAAQFHALDTRYRYLSDDVVRSKRQFEAGLVSIQVLRSAQAAYDMAAVERENKRQALTAVELSIASARRSFEDQTRLIQMQEADLARAQAQRKVTSPASGILKWVVTEGSYVPAGTAVAFVEE